MICVVVLPSLADGVTMVLLDRNVQDVGELHRRGDVYFYSRSPLCVFDFLFIIFFCSRCRGDSQGRDIYSTLVLPSLNRFCCCFISLTRIHVGENTQGSCFKFSFSLL